MQIIFNCTEVGEGVWGGGGGILLCKPCSVRHAFLSFFGFLPPCPFSFLTYSSSAGHPFFFFLFSYFYLFIFHFVPPPFVLAAFFPVSISLFCICYPTQ